VSVLNIKRIVAGMAGVLVAVSLGVAISAVGLAVLAAGSGADATTLFTDPTLSAQAERPTTWEPASTRAVASINERTKQQLAGLWHDAMVLRLEGAAPTSANTSRFAPTVLTGFGTERERSSTTLVHHRLRVETSTIDGHVVTLRALTETRLGQMTVHESFDTTMVLRATGWRMESLVRVGLTKS